MNHLIREKRRVAFNYKKFTSEVALTLSQIVDSEARDAEASGVPYHLMYSLDTLEDTAFESISNTIFTADTVNASHIIRKVHMRFYTLDNTKSIEVQFVHAMEEAKAGNFIMVSGDDSTWVNGMLSRLSTVVVGAENQFKFNSFYRGIAATGLVIAAIVESYRLYQNYLVGYVDWDIFSFMLIPVALGWIILGFNTLSYMDKLWPSIEVSTGPEHLNPLIRKRKNLIWALSALIIPLLLSVAYDILKGVRW